MIEAYFKPTYQRILIEPVLARLARFKFSPNLITALSCLTGLAVFASLYRHGYIDAILLMLLSGYLDTLDGAYARATGQTSIMGAIYDILSDRMVEAAAVLGLFCVDPVNRGWYCLLMLASILICVTSFLLVGIYSHNQSQKSFHYSSGLMERPEAFIFFIAMILLPQYFSFLALAFSMLVFNTAYYRVKQFKRDINNGITPVRTT